MHAFTTPEPITATLITAGARIHITASERPDTMVLVEPIDSTSKSDVKVAESTEVDFSAGELSVKTTKSGGKSSSVAITIELPAGSRLVLNTAWTDVHAEGRLGDCELNVASGQVELGNVAALRAQLAASTVEIGHVAGTADVDGGSAGVRIGEVEGAVRYEVSSGKVWIGHAWSDVGFNGASGSLDIDRADGDVNVEAGDCPIRIGRMSRGQADLRTASGGIEVGVSETTAASVDADSTKGAVRNSVPEPVDAAEHDDKLKIYARTRLDDIVIRPCARGRSIG